MELRSYGVKELRSYSVMALKELKELSQMLCFLEVCAVNELMVLGLKKWMS